MLETAGWEDDWCVVGSVGVKGTEGLHAAVVAGGRAVSECKSHTSSSDNMFAVIWTGPLPEEV